MTTTKIYTLELPPELRERFTALVKKNGQTASGVIREYMAAYVAEKKNQKQNNKIQETDHG